MLKQIMSAGATACLLLVTACGAGPAEKTGENMDSAIEESTQGSTDMMDGPMENAGEAMDEANEDAADAADDATNTPATPPVTTP